MTARRLDSLTGLRGVAALAVLLFHAILAFAPGGVLADSTYYFPVAVSFFFILSGFVLTWSWDQSSSVLTFWRDRAARIVPVYLFAWLLAVAGLSWLTWTPTDSELLASALLVQAWVPGDHFAIAVNVPAWSLSCEVAFYAALPLVATRVLRLRSRALRRNGFGVAAWIAIVPCIVAFFPLAWWPGLRGAEFCSGVLLATCMRRGWRPRGRSFAVGTASIAILGALLASRTPMSQSLVNAVAAPAFVVLIAFATGRELAGGRSWLQSRALVHVGERSYSLYLTHWIVVVVVSRFLIGPAWIPVGMSLSVVLAFVVYAVLERPAQRWLRAPTQAARPSSLDKSASTRPRDGDAAARHLPGEPAIKRVQRMIGSSDVDALAQ